MSGKGGGWGEHERLGGGPWRGAVHVVHEVRARMPCPRSDWSGPPMAVLLNKSDLASEEDVQELCAWYKDNCRAEQVGPRPQGGCVQGPQARRRVAWAL